MNEKIEQNQEKPLNSYELAVNALWRAEGLDTFLKKEGKMMESLEAGKLMDAIIMNAPKEGEEFDEGQMKQLADKLNSFCDQFQYDSGKRKY